jgi:hypothetical protein
MRKPEEPLGLGYVPSNPDSQPSVDPNLLVTLASKGRFSGSEPVQLEFTIRNQGTETARVCLVFTPLESRKRFGFEVIGPDGAELARKHPLEAGPMPGAADHLLVESGGQLKASLDLRQDYELGRGSYAIRFRGQPYVNHLPDSAPHRIAIE